MFAVGSTVWAGKNYPVGRNFPAVFAWRPDVWPAAV